MNAHKNNIYDYIIIGGGISGLYCAKQLCEKYNNKKRILIIDERNYLGGRLITHYKPQYEIGGARFHMHHKLLVEMINSYGIEYQKIPSTVDYINKTRQEVKYYKDAHDTFSNIMQSIIKKAKKYSKKELQSMTTKSFIDKITGNQELSTKLINIFGYVSEFVVMNAFDALKQFENDFIEKEYYVLKNGFTHFIHKIKQELDTYNTNFKMNSFAYDVKKLKNNNYCVYSSHNKSNIKYQFESQHVIFATKSQQLKTFKILKPIYNSISCISGQPLLRIYAKFPKLKIYDNKPWFHALPRITTNSILRHIIPIDMNSGLIMISYTDGPDVKPFMKNKLTLKNEEVIKNMILKELSILFPNTYISYPTYFKCHLWTIGAHYWKPNCDSKTNIKQIQFPMKNVYVVGEAVSNKQAWIEGSLESVQNIIQAI